MMDVTAITNINLC